MVVLRQNIQRGTVARTAADYDGSSVKSSDTSKTNENSIGSKNKKLKLRLSLPFLSSYKLGRNTGVPRRQKSCKKNKENNDKNSRDTSSSRSLTTATLTASGHSADSSDSFSSPEAPLLDRSIASHHSSCTLRTGSSGAEIDSLDPDEILMLGYSHWPARVLLAACEFRLFCKLAAAPGRCMTHAQIVDALKLHPTARHTMDFLDALVALNVLVRIGNDPSTAVYTNATEADIFLVQGKPTYVGDTLEICSKQLYSEWTDLGKMLTDRSVPWVDVGVYLDQALRTAKTRLLQARLHGRLPDACKGRIDELSHERIIRLGFAFWESRVLLTAMEIGLFTTLSQVKDGQGMTQSEIMEHHGFCSKTRTKEFLGLLVKNGILERIVQADRDPIYLNSPEAARFLDVTHKEECVGVVLSVFSVLFYGNLSKLPETLQTGVGQTGLEFYLATYQDPAKLAMFMEGLIGWSSRAFKTFVRQFDFSQYDTMCDIGGATGQLAAYVAKRHLHMSCVTTDLPPVLPIAEAWIQRWAKEWHMNDLPERVVPVASDMFTQDFPKADVITMATLLHDWNLEAKKKLIKKAYDALPEPVENGGTGGALVSIETVIDDGRRSNVEGLCMSMLALNEFGADGGFAFTQTEFNSWCREVGFTRFQKIHLFGPTSAVVAYKE